MPTVSVGKRGTMTDLGRGDGPQPWNAADPLYGDTPQGSASGVPGQQPSWSGYDQVGEQGWQADPHGRQGRARGGPQYPQQPPYRDPYGTGQQPQQYPQYPQQPSQQQARYVVPQSPQYPGMQPAGHPGQQQPPQYDPRYDPQYDPQYDDPRQRPQPYPGPRQPPQYVEQEQYADTQQPTPSYTDRRPSQPYADAARPQPQQQNDGFDWEAEAAALSTPAPPVGPASEEVWAEPEADEESEGSFFGERDDSRSAERRRKQQGKKSGRRNGGACLVISVVLVAVLGGGGYYGYTFYHDHFGPPPDYAGVGTGSVQVEVKSGDSVGAMALALKQAGVIKSADAFLAADTKGGGKAQAIQPGFYSLKHRMAASAALDEMLAALGGDRLIIREGIWAKQVYAQIDEKLKLDKGTTEKVAKRQRDALGLPAYAKGNVEGFLFPARYSIGKSTKPIDLLKQMVANANTEYTKLGIEAGAEGADLDSAYQVIIEASIVQAEGFDSNDFGKIARVIHNRLHWKDQPHLLGMDSTLNYARGITTLNNSSKDTRFKSPYNTYLNPGLPPAPIGSPGEEAIRAVLNPEPGDWHFFTTVKGHETRFEVTQQEHDSNVREFNENQKAGDR